MTFLELFRSTLFDALDCWITIWKDLKILKVEDLDSFL